MKAMEMNDRLIDIIEDRIALSTIIGIILEAVETGVAPPPSCIPTLHDTLDEEAVRLLLGIISDTGRKRDDS